MIFTEKVKNMKRKWVMVFAILLASLVLAACGSKGQEQQSDTKNEGGIDISFKAPEKTEAGKKLEYTINVMKKGQPIVEADVVVHLEMKEMDHGKNGFRARMIEPGVYKGQAVLPMGGDWVAYVNVKTAGEEVTRSFDFKAEGDMMLPEEMKKAGLNEDGSLANPDF
jgi:hypothetical protein